MELWKIVEAHKELLRIVFDRLEKVEERIDKLEE